MIKVLVDISTGKEHLVKMQFGMTFQMVDLVTQIPLHMVKLMGMVLL